MSLINREQIELLGLQIFINSPIGELEQHQDPLTGEESTRLKWKRVPFPEEVDVGSGSVKMWVPQSVSTDSMTKVEVDPSNPPQKPEEMEVEASLTETQGNVLVCLPDGEVIQVTDPNALT